MRRRAIALLLALGLGCKDDPKPDPTPKPAGGKPPETKARLGHHGSARTDPFAVISPSLLRTHTKALTSEAMEGRMPGTRGGQRAVAYVITVLQDLGIDPPGDDHRQAVPMTEVLHRDATFAWVEDQTETAFEPRFLPASTMSTVLPAVFVGRDEFTSEDVHGKAIVALAQHPRRLPDHSVLQRAQRAGARAYLRVHGRASMPSLVGPEPPQLLLADLDEPPPGLDLEQLDTPAPLPHQLRVTVQTREVPRRDVNVLGVLDGASTETVLVLAHWDDTGASTQRGEAGASGLSGLLAIAAAVKAHHRSAPPQRRIVFLATTGHHQGQLGAQRYADEPVVPWSDVRAIVELTRVGPTLSITTNDDALLGRLQRVGSTQGLPVRRVDEPGATDLEALCNDCGIPAIALVEASNDTELDHALGSKTVRAMLSLVLELASESDPPSAP